MSQEQHIAALAALGRMYLEALQRDPSQPPTFLAVPEGLTLDEIREAVEWARSGAFDWEAEYVVLEDDPA